MNYKFTSDKPIYVQLVDLFKIGILSGELALGSKLDSVRELAVDAKVNPNTMQKALSELEKFGLVRTERTSGRFITDDEKKITAMRKELAESEIGVFLDKMKTLGFSNTEVVSLISDFKEGEL